MISMDDDAFKMALEKFAKGFAEASQDANWVILVRPLEVKEMPRLPDGEDIPNE